MEFYSPKTLGFFKSLKRNNRSEWYHQHKPEYQSHFVEPSLNLLKLLGRDPIINKMGYTPNGKKSIFRLNRDVRFSANKSPFKTYNSLTITPSGHKDDAPMFYMHIEPGNLFLCAGIWQPHPKLLARLRLWASFRPNEAKKLLKTLKKSGFKHLDDYDKLKRLPRGFENTTDQEIQELLKHRHWMVSETFTEKDLYSKNLSKKVSKFMKKSEPLLKEIKRHVETWRMEGGDEVYNKREAALLDKHL